MKLMTLIGVLLITLGLIGVAYDGFSYVTNSDTVSVGDLDLQIKETRQIPYSLFVSSLSIFAGVILVVLDQRKRSCSKPS